MDNVGRGNKLTGGITALFVGAALIFGLHAAGADAPSPSNAPPRPAPDHAQEISIFYYPWYGTPTKDKTWRHWDQNVSVTADSGGSNYFPERGAYSSSDNGLIGSQMREIANVGINTVVVSWWGRGSYEDSNLQKIIDVAHGQSLRVAAHIEPYGGRSVSTLKDDASYLVSKGVSAIYVYQANKMGAGQLTAMNDAVAAQIPIFANSSDENSVRDGSFTAWAQSAHFDGIYTYDPYGFSPNDFSGICDAARTHQLLCSPSVGPGWIGNRATKLNWNKDRANGATYDAAWQGAINAHADVVSITSYNEWHEGTQIEPAISKCTADHSFCYMNYDGAYGKHDAEANYAYMSSTFDWVTKATGKTPDLTRRLDILSASLTTASSASSVSAIRPDWLK